MIDDMAEPDSPIHYRSEVVETLTSLLYVWGSAGFQKDIVPNSGRGMDTIEIKVLWTLGSRGPARAADIAAALDAGASGVSKAVAKLRAAGLVERQPSATDLRAHILRLTPEGHRVAQELHDVGDAMMTEIFSTWESKDVTTLTALLGRFAADFDRYAKGLHGDRAAGADHE